MNCFVVPMYSCRVLDRKGFCKVLRKPMLREVTKEQALGHPLSLT